MLTDLGSALSALIAPNCRKRPCPAASQAPSGRCRRQPNHAPMRRAPPTNEPADSARAGPPSRSRRRSRAERHGLVLVEPQEAVQDRSSGLARRAERPSIQTDRV